jgi:hypothetical protein
MWKFSVLVLMVIPLLTVKPALADPADILCTVLNSGGTTLDFSVDPSGALLGIAVYTAPASPVSPSTSTSSVVAQAPIITNFPISQIPNFWLDLTTMKVHGVDPATHLQSILISYDRNLGLGKVTMMLPGYNLNNQILTCQFD